MEHRAVFWHLISLRTQGSISQTSPSASHFIISLLPIRTLPAAHTVAFLFMYVFIYLFLLFLSNRAVFCLKAPWNYSYCQPASSSSSTEAGGRKTHRFIQQKTKRRRRMPASCSHKHTGPFTHTHTHKCFCTFFITCQSWAFFGEILHPHVHNQHHTTLPPWQILTNTNGPFPCI